MKLAMIDLDQVATIVLENARKVDTTTNEKRKLVLSDRAVVVTEFLAKLGITVEVYRDGSGNLYSTKAYQVATRFASDYDKA